MLARLSRSTLARSAAACVRPVRSSAASMRFSHEEAAPRRPEPQQLKKLTDVGSRRIFTSDHDTLRESVRKFWEKEVAPFHAQWEEEGNVSRDLWLRAGEQGLLAMTMPAQYGGPEGTILDAAIMWEEQSYTGFTGPGFALHSDIVAPYVLHYGTEAQKTKYINGLCSGTMIGAIAMTEPGAGSDLQGIKTIAKRDGDDWILNGSKTFITNGFMCDMVIVVAKTDTSKGAHGISLFIVDAGTPGFNKGRKLKKLGLRAQDTSELFFEDVRLPASAVLGEVNKGFYYLMKELPQERLLIADMAVAASEAMYEWGRTYVKERKAFGKTLAELQTIRHRLADVKTNVVVGRAFLDTCIELHAIGKLDNSTASMAKAHATDLQGKTADEILQLHGGWGFMWEYPIARAFADARVQRIYGGTNEIMKELIARDI